MPIALSSFALAAAKVLVAELGNRAPELLQYILEELGDRDAVRNVRSNADWAMAIRRAEAKMNAEKKNES